MQSLAYEAPTAEVLSFENDYIFAALTSDNSALSSVQKATSGGLDEDELPPIFIG